MIIPFPGYVNYRQSVPSEYLPLCGAAGVDLNGIDAGFEHGPGIHGRIDVRLQDGDLKPLLQPRRHPGRSERQAEVISRLTIPTCGAILKNDKGSPN